MITPCSVRVYWNATQHVAARLVLHLRLWNLVNLDTCELLSVRPVGRPPLPFHQQKESRTLLFTSVAAAPLCFVITASIIFSPSFFHFLLFPPRSFLICLVPLLISACRFPSPFAQIILHFLTLFASFCLYHWISSSLCCRLCWPCCWPELFDFTTLLLTLWYIWK